MFGVEYDPHKDPWRFRVMRYDREHDEVPMPGSQTNRELAVRCLLVVGVRTMPLVRLVREPVPVHVVEHVERWAA